MKLDEKYFEEFKKAAGKYIEILNLKNWKVYFIFINLTVEDIYARVILDYQSHTVTMEVSNEIPDGIMPNIDMLARHECLEILLQPLREKAMARKFDSDSFDLESHSIIRVLEKIIK